MGWAHGDSRLRFLPWVSSRTSRAVPRFDGFSLNSGDIFVLHGMIYTVNTLSLPLSTRIDPKQIMELRDLLLILRRRHLISVCKSIKLFMATRNFPSD